MRYVTGIAIALIALASGAGMAANMSREEYRDAKKAIETEYLAERRKCGANYGPVYRACVARAHGMRDVSKAELQAKDKPSARHYYDAAIARAKSAYNVAKVECEEKRGDATKACKADAKAAYDRATTEAKNALASNRKDQAAKK